jgi:hypothetical protein
MRQVARRGWTWMAGTFDMQDGTLAVGVALLAIGGGKIYEPLEWIIPGAFFTVIAWPKRPVMPKRRSSQES